MIIKRYSESRKTAEVLLQYNVLHVDSSEFSRYAAGSLLMEYDFIIKRFASVRTLDDVPGALQTFDYDLLLVNAAAPNTGFDDFKKIRKSTDGMVTVIYNFSGSRFEKLMLLKAGVNALFDTDTPFEELLFCLQELRIGSVLHNNVVGAADLKKSATIAGAAKDFSRDEVAWIKEYCKEADLTKVAIKCRLTAAAASRLHQDLQAKTGCESRADFIRLAMLYKWIRTGEQLLSEIES